MRTTRAALDVTNRTVEGYRLRLRADPAEPKFVVVRQSPSAGSFARRLAHVTLTLGLGIPASQGKPNAGYNLFVQGSVPLAKGCKR